MKKMKIASKEEARGLLPAGRDDCPVGGCRARATIAVAGDDTGTTRMCLHHATAWTESNLCRDIAQHNSAASTLALTTWLNIANASSLAARWAS